ncbi:peptide-N(4)-(N-acetyl-beta-glucosaminyl)asparagine amidase isoform X1 [Solanum verrucosum]|uniref:peptide-N(4)-(N-acetyl-beta- glucosaminyl)asparagine amidase isoform X1 n=2 Tax=Solanum verrucosum TaxID=315347 RepID=UPI0020D0C5FC|nr:peptide-N(4)-(N-acetyl-beta-glucosaminyl)asparagine amidase isoform X1 [Solanum verrucosum]
MMASKSSSSSTSSHSHFIFFNSIFRFIYKPFPLIYSLFQVLKYQLFSLTSVPPDQQKILGRDDQIVSDESDLASISDKLRLVSIDEVEEEIVAEEKEKLENLAMSDEELARLIQAEEEALMMQHFVSRESKEQVEQRIQQYVNQVQMYEDPHRQEMARKTVPVDKLEEKALISLGREGNYKPTKVEQDNAFLLQLLFWFKQSFRWVNSPPCDSCGNDTRSQGMGVANSSETLYGASRVELFRCNSCSNITRFPRYDDPLKLLETRKGRCGEWANCFTLYCRAFGYDSRLILDFTDHVWTECFSPSLGRWMHLDPCEGIYDNPLLYEKGWKKSLNYVFAIAKDGVHDVTKRYTRKWPEVLSQRNIISEPSLAAVLSDITRELRKTLSAEVISALEERDRIEKNVIEQELHRKDDSSVSLPGRLSGDKEWRIARSEFVSAEKNSLSSSSCPVRKCIDDHVTNIYSAFSPVLSKLIEYSPSKKAAAEILEIFRKILVDLKNSPFRTRRISVKSVSSSSGDIFSKMLASFDQLLNALSLKSELGVNGSIDICLASDPVKTSVALPVMFHALDDVIYNIGQCARLDSRSLSWPLLKLNRLCSGLVLASGEELPFGVATCAFDGTRMSKWEEPNGAAGCWIIYQVADNRMVELVAYEFMSANDAPERDPKDWVLEGSENGGSSWHLLDKQTSQMFDKRFQRKAFTVSSPGYLSNAFRFRFLAVRDKNATSRFQIGSIDLFAGSS